MVDAARLISRDEATRKVWGNIAKGHILDWFYARNDKVCVNIFQLATGAHAGHTDDEPAVFGADAVFIVLEGEMMLVNPETGENLRASKGETTFIRKDTWNNAFNIGDGPLTCLEFFHPSPDTGTGGAYGRSVPPLEVETWTQDELIRNWPMRRDQAAAEASMWLIRESDYLWRMEGELTFPVGIIVSTEHATIGKMYHRPGVRSGEVARGGDTGLYVDEGRLVVEIVDTGEFFEMGPGDGGYVPAGQAHRFYNPTSERVAAYFAVAPQYLP